MAANRQPVLLEEQRIDLGIGGCVPAFIIIWSVEDVGGYSSSDHPDVDLREATSIFDSRSSIVEVIADAEIDRQ